MSTANLQKSVELQYGQFFIDWLNQNFGLDYITTVNLEEYSDIDVYAHSSSGKPTLNLQMVTSDGPTMKLASDTKQKMNRGLEINIIDVDLVGRVSKVIVDKNKKYPLALKEDLILIIQGFMPTPAPEEIQKSFNTYAHFPFKGIYYVSLPVSSSTHRDYENNGFVAAIKEVK